MKNPKQLATRAQADAVRRYLETLGVTLSHVQALEVIARGQGMRSRHGLAAETAASKQSAAQWVDTNVSGNSALIQAMKNHAQAADVVPHTPRATLDSQGTFKCTRVSYGYTDGSNCKRASSIVFRGRLTRLQLRVIANRLDEGMFFVPCQVGFESLHLAFTDEGGDDHYWHKLELGDKDQWTYDADGFVLQAGDVEQASEATAGEYATDADCDNLFWRFARLLRWDTELQRAAVTSHVYQRPEPPEEGYTAQDVMKLVTQWRDTTELRHVNGPLLTELARSLLDAGFLPFPGVDLEVRRPVGPNAYQFCILQAVDPEHGDVAVNFDVSTLSGIYLTETPVLALSQDRALEGVGQVQHQLEEQLRAIRVMPAAYDETVE